MTWYPDLFHVGPQKTGTTWIYRCFREHPQVVTSDVDAIHYYSMLYHRGSDWYRSQFADSDAAAVALDPTPNYLRSPVAPERIAKDNPQAKIIMCLREPIERAFSHYWHEKKKNRFDFSFDEVLDNFDLFTNWIEPGLYSVHIGRYLQFFPRKQIKVVLFDDLEADPASFIRELFLFAGIEPDFLPSIVKRKVNVARPKEINGTRVLRRQAVHKLANVLRQRFSSIAILDLYVRRRRMETLDRINPVVLRELRRVIEPELQVLEKMFGIDLSNWRLRYEKRA